MNATLAWKTVDIRPAERCPAEQWYFRGVVKIVALALLCITICACDPPWSAPETERPFFVRATNHSDIEIVLMRCAAAGLRRVEVFRGDGPFDGDERKVWDVVFPSASDASSFILGRVPAGGSEKVRWIPGALGNDRRQRFVVRVTGDDLASGLMSFAQADLDNGQVRYNSRNISAQAFAAVDPCKRR